jgi:hypothetical protein
MAQAALSVFCEPTISVAWVELQPAAKQKWTKIARAAHAALFALWLGEK